MFALVVYPYMRGLIDQKLTISIVLDISLLSAFSNLLMNFAYYCFD